MTCSLVQTCDIQLGKKTFNIFNVESRNLSFRGILKLRNFLKAQITTKI